VFANYLIGLREGLEACLIVAILVAYLVKIDQRRTLPRLWFGAGLAVLLSLGVGALLQFTSQELTFQAQETFGGAMSIVAAALISWMVFWMASHAHELRGHLHGEVDRALTGSAWMLTFIAFMAVAREGIETTLFLWAGIRAAGSSTSPLLGALLGLATAVLVGALIYRGAVRLNLAKLFTWTGVALIVVAAGVLGYGVHDLQEAGVLPGLHALAFDVSAQIPPDSWYGTLLKGTVNFSPATTWLQLVVWVAYLVPTLVLYLRVIDRRGATQIKEKKNATVPAT
jgi:high-affinity iron transporter